MKTGNFTTLSCDTFYNLLGNFQNSSSIHNLFLQKDFRSLANAQLNFAYLLYNLCPLQMLK